MTETEPDLVTYLQESYDPDEGTSRINCVYITRDLLDDLHFRFGFAPRPDQWASAIALDKPTTLFNVPLVVNNGMATVGGNDWALSFRHLPTGVTMRNRRSLPHRDHSV